MNGLNFKPFPILETKRLILRNMDMSDTKDLLMLRNDASVNKYINRPKQMEHDGAQKFIRDIHIGIEENKWIYWVISIKENPKLSGTICIWNISDDKNKGELGYELNPFFQGQGFMNEALNSVISFGWDAMKLKTIEAYTHEDNAHSVKLLEKNGFIIDKNRIDQENLANLIYVLTNPILY